MQFHKPIPPVPSDTTRTAKAVYSRSNIYLSIGDCLPVLLTDIHLDDSTHMGAPSRLGMPPLALVTFFQYLEELSDRQATDATGMRIDWKYALHLPMNYPGLNSSTLCGFRQILLRQPASQQEFQRVLDRLSEAGYAQETQARPLDALRVLAEVCFRTRLDRVLTNMRISLQVLAIRHPEWLRRISLPHWYERYGQHPKDLNLGTENLEQRAYAQAIGADGIHLLEAISEAGDPALTDMNEILALRQVWYEQFEFGDGKVTWRKEVCASCSLPGIF